MSPIFRLSLAVILVSSACADLAWADCEAYRHLEDKAWVDGDCMETPLGEHWWPHPIWGEDDEAGSTNWYTKPEVVQRALAMIKTGNVLNIGHTYTADMPLFGSRQFTLRIIGAPTGAVGGRTAGSGTTSS